MQPQQTGTLRHKRAWRPSVRCEIVVVVGRQRALDEQVERINDEQCAHEHTQSDADAIRQTSERRRTCNTLWNYTTTTTATNNNYMLLLLLHMFNGLFSRTSWVSRYQKVKPIWISIKKETVSGSGWVICKSAPRSRQITMPALHRSVFYEPDALHIAQPTVSKHWRQSAAATTTTTTTPV